VFIFPRDSGIAPPPIKVGYYEQTVSLGILRPVELCHSIAVQRALATARRMMP